MLLNGTSRSLPPLPSTRTIFAAQIHIVEIEAGELAQTQARRVEQLEDRAVAPAERIVAVGRVEKRVISSSDRCAGMRTSRFGVRDERAGSSSISLFAAQIAEKRAHRRQLARGRARATAPRACRSARKLRSAARSSACGRQLGGA